MSNKRRMKNIAHRRNKRIRQRLIDQGYTPEEAQAHVDETGRLTHELQKARDQQDAQAYADIQKQLNRSNGPLQPDRPQSVRAITTGFETHRKRH